MGRKDRQVSQRGNAQRQIISHFLPKSPVAEQYRTIRTNIEFSGSESGMKTIVVTSAGPGEGKSTTVANLAVVMAQQGKRVILIDADLRKPTVHYTFGVNNLVGLSNVLTAQAEADNVISSTMVSNLSVMTCGPIPPNPSELLGSTRMEKLLKELMIDYDYVLFDTPPLLAVADAQILSNKCDGSILVVSSGKTDREGAIKAKDMLSQSQAKLLGAVLNNKPKKDNQYYYYYGVNKD